MGSYLSKLKNQEQLSTLPLMEESVLIRSFKTRHSYEEPETAAKKRLDEMSALRDKVQQVEQRLASIDSRFDTITQLLAQRFETEHLSNKSIKIESVISSPRAQKGKRLKLRGPNGQFISPKSKNPTLSSLDANNLQKPSKLPIEKAIRDKKGRTRGYVLKLSSRKSKISKRDSGKLSDISFQKPTNRIFLTNTHFAD